MRMNFNTILAGRGVNALAALDAGNRARAFQEDAQFQNALRPMQMESAQLGVQQQRQALELGQEQIANIRRQASAAAAAAEDKATLAREYEQAQNGMKMALTALTTGDQQAWNQVAAGFGMPGLPMDESGARALDAVLSGIGEGLGLGAAIPGGGGQIKVQSSDMLPDSSGVMKVMTDGTVQVTTAGGKTLAGDEAKAFVEAALENATAQQRAIYEARRVGTNTGEAATGADAAAASERGKQGVKLATDFFNESRTVRSNIRNLRDGIRAIDEGAKSGVVYNMIPDVTVASASLRNAMNNMGLDVVGSVTFGALSEGELRLAMDTAVPQGLEAPELRVWLSRKLEAQEKALEALEEAVQHFDGGGTTAEWIEKVKKWDSARATQGGDQGESASLNFSAMSLDELLNVDLDAIPDDQLDDYSRRLKEAQNQ